MTSDVPLLRFMVFSALIGFVVFCASYALLVWRKRRGGPATGGNRIRRWSVACLVLGCLGICVSLAIREAVRADGILGGDGLHAVRATSDMRIVELAEAGSPVKEGDVLARFTSPEALAEIEQAELARDVLKTEREKLQLQPPASPPAELARKHDQAIAERRHHETNQTFERSNRLIALRETLQGMVNERNTAAKIESELQVAVGELKQAVAKRDVARLQLERERKLAAKNNISTSDFNEREKEVYSLDAEVAKNEKRVAATEEQRRQSKESLAKFERIAAQQEEVLDKAQSVTREALAAAVADCEKLDRAFAEHARTADYARRIDLDGFEIKIKQAEAQLAAKKGKLEQRAPFDGVIVYRNPSPGTALNHGPLLVLGKPDALRLRFRLPEKQVEALRGAGSVTVELAETENSIEQRFPGKFLAATALTREPGMSVVELDCQVPPETVAALAEGKPIKARFSWRPPLMNLWPFPWSLALLALGVFGLVLTGLGGLKPSWPRARKLSPADDDDGAVNYAPAPAGKAGDTVEARDTIPERPLLPNVPREVPLEPWEHPVGVRLREAIIREDVTQDLLDAIETAIEQKHDAVIVPIREALRRAPTVPDHARNLIERLNADESGDELAMIERRCLAQRLTFLLYTVGLDLPGKCKTLVSANRVSSRVAGS
jgi:multidrug resistance efflux pump